MSPLRAPRTGFACQIGKTAIGGTSHPVGNTDTRATFRLRIAVRGWLMVALTALAWGTAAAAPNAFIVTQIWKSADTTEVVIRFACPNRLLKQSPTSETARSEITLMRMDRCDGSATSVSEATRPPGRELAALEEIEYTVRSGNEAILRLQFDRAVRVMADQSGDLRSLRLRVQVPPGSTPAVKATPSEPVAKAPVAAAAASAALVARAEARAQAATQQAKPIAAPITPLFMVNLRSTTDRIEPGTEGAGLPQDGQLLYVADTQVDDRAWHRLRLGFFATEDEAHSAWLTLRSRYPDSWVAEASAAERTAALNAGSVVSPTAAPTATMAAANEGLQTLSDAEVAELLAQTRGAIIGQDYPRAIELATRILQEPPRTETAQSRELLGLARERNGEVEQAAAEYRRYLSDYPDGTDAVRVKQRLTALTMASEQPRPIGRADRAPVARANPWDATGSFSQHYLTNSSDLGGQGGASTQSVLLNDGDFVARYRGERFNFSTRTTAAYRYSIDEPGWSAGSLSRFYNLYVDLQDRGWGLNGRLGRQRMRTDGVQGLIDGLHLSWQAQPDFRVNITAGYPVYSSAEGFNTDRTLVGASVDFTNLPGGLEANAFFNTQAIDGIENRQALGGQVRYIDDRNSLIGAIDYDIGFNKVVSFNLLGNRSFDSGLTISASADYRRSPFLTAEAALVGQTAGTVDELLQSLTEDQIRDLALDRSGEMLTYTLGFSRPLARRWEVTGDFIFAQLAQGPSSGGVLTLPDSGDEYYVYASLVGSSLFIEGDVSILGLRYTDTYAARIYSVYLDPRFPITRALRLNPRLEISQRQILVDDSTEILVIPSLRLLYRFAGHYEIEFEGGGEQGSRTGSVVDTDTMTYYIYLGYRADF
jgi:hypothetical protein